MNNIDENPTAMRAECRKEEFIMIKKVFIGIIAAGMILTTIPTVNAEDEITLDEVTDQIIDISDKYN